MIDWVEEESVLREEVVALLNAVFTDRFHSLAAYILEAKPYVQESDAELVQRIRQIAEYDRAEATRLAEIIESMEGIPQVMAPYPHDIAEFNYLALPYLKNELARKLQLQADQYDRHMPKLQRFDDARQIVERISKDLRNQADELTA